MKLFTVLYNTVSIKFCTMRQPDLKSIQNIYYLNTILKISKKMIRGDPYLQFAKAQKF